ncbi:ABC transporter permease subunit [Agrobacterium vitis]|uniref:sn-glycerol-3-phosphate transport system permease protein UgpA n=1 Tax=Agrobacterium vitis TaxID=373 RepID=A0AAE5AVY3_AGRVI|nr:ABC transporter permease subunit [Agrobacterium vitis]MCF1499245.1 ABC transporter permease subunit [Allorhizobium sp. Av2]MCM2439509.1 ABC transporter permease subunit [Agrobacterium vitis]MUZ57592.1 ABC transporter permease subunit [Agrobacterium vitis]MVA68151.1 ABC transporter permease subunit [Agrobacterium vitis]MVA87825.1 ABC transporter permease subunit [Agrobacterium vitis]
MKRVQFNSRFLPYFFLAPQFCIVAIFFYWPAVQAIQSSFYIEDPFGFGATFVGLANYTDMLSSPEYRKIALFTLCFSVLVTFLVLSIGTVLAVKADAVIRGQSAYKTLLIVVYAIAPPVAGLIGMMFFDQHIGPFVKFVALFGWDMKVGLNYFDTAFAMVAIAVWNQIPYNFIFILSGLQGIPASVREAATLDCRSGTRRFWTVTMPLLTPTAFFLLVVNMTYSLFDTFAVIDVIVKDKAADNPITLVYKVYLDGFRGNDIGSSSAQSVILMVVVLVLTMIQFRFIERRVHYG